MALQARLTQGWRSRLRRSGIDVASNRIEPHRTALCLQDTELPIQSKLPVNHADA